MDSQSPSGSTASPEVEVDARDRAGNGAHSGLTLPALLEARAQRGASVLFSDRRTTWTGRDALQAAARRAGALAAAGIGRGDRVALMCSNRIEFIDMVLGCGWLGAIVVPLNTASRGMQLQHILNNCGATLLVIEADLVEAVATLDFSTLALQAAWLIEPRVEPWVEPLTEQPARMARMAQATQSAGAPTTTFAHGLESRPLVLPLATVPYPPAGEPLAAAETGPGDTLAILYTSGTSGPSKGVTCPHAQFYWWGVHTARNLGVTRDDVLYTVLPLFHTNALNSFFQALVSGAALIADARFSASRFFPALGETGATVTYLLGAMVPILLSKPAGGAERAHRVRIALAPGVPAQFHETFVARCGIELLDGFGSTETNFVIGGGIAQQRPGWMGRVPPEFDARVVDQNDTPVADGAAGELIVRASEPFAFATGYFGMPEKTVEAWRNLWFHTGDRVVRNADGYFKFVDRLKDAIRRRGENISSYEVEQALLSHPAIETVAVYAVRSELAEDEVMATLVLRAETALSAHEVIMHCVPRLPYFAVPRYLEFAAELPKTENGKIQKFKLRERGIGPGTWDREAAGIVLQRPAAKAR